jgi:hypothetical protein
MIEQLKSLRLLAIRPHYTCDDVWYSCPLSADGCADDSLPGDECNCGAEEHNIKVEAVFEKLMAEVSKC